MQDLNTLMSGGQARRDMLGSMEPRGGSETELMQVSTLVALFVLPGLASLMLRKKDEHDPQFSVMWFVDTVEQLPSWITLCCH